MLTGSVIIAISCIVGFCIGFFGFNLMDKNRDSKDDELMDNIDSFMEDMEKIRQKLKEKNNDGNTTYKQ